MAMSSWVDGRRRNEIEFERERRFDDRMPMNMKKIQFFLDG